ncbi:hypothetical protein SH668x_002060 [Planctomicrobium sp. SH668]|uniref:hypothetical protein n=1 Tax=Planctomicrobium sp. SH668 TaxID=3448126 RepID=UPI003F5B3ED4
MNPDLVLALEEECEAALKSVIEQYQLAGVTPQVLHLMAKAAVTVLEAAEATSSQSIWSRS